MILWQIYNDLFFLSFLTFVPYKGIETEEINLCLIFKWLFLQCFLITWIISDRFPAFTQLVFSRCSGHAWHSALWHKEHYLCGCCRVMLFLQLLLTAFPFDEQSAGPIFSSSFNFFLKIDLPAVYSFVGIHVRVASLLYCPYLLLVAKKLFHWGSNVFTNINNWSSRGHGTKVVLNFSAPRRQNRNGLIYHSCTETEMLGTKYLKWVYRRSSRGDVVMLVSKEQSN